MFIENVQGYKNFESFGLIRAALDKAGYWSNATVENAADYGVPQTRKRLILRAVRNRWLPPLPDPEPWRGWYEAIEDLLPGLPESAFVPWQLARLPAEMMTLMQPGAGNTNFKEAHAGRGCRRQGEPSHTVTALEEGGTEPRAFLANQDSKCGLVNASEPAFTRAWLNEGRVVKMSPRAPARFQSVPDNYELPDKTSLACKVLGNGVACRMAEKLIKAAAR